MPEEKPTVDINQEELYNLASVLGLMTRAFKDWDDSIFETPHEVGVPAIMCAIFLLDRKLGGEFFKIAWVSFVDVIAERAILVNTPKCVRWPEWDPETLKHPDITPVADLCIMLAAWNFACKDDVNPPENYLGPLFSLAGVIMAGVERGFYLEDEKSRALYEEQRKSLASSHGSEEEFIAALKTQLSSIGDSLIERRKKLQN